MGKNVKQYSKEFLDYQKMIVNHPHYKGIPYSLKDNGEIKWVEPANGDLGKKRIKWCENKAKTLGIEIKPGYFAKTMLLIHPTKKKPCQVCGRTMSLYYIYLSKSFAKTLNKKFNTNFTDIDDIYTVYAVLLNKLGDEKKVNDFLYSKFKIDNANRKLGRDKLISFLENECRNNGKKLLGPGCMSNYPDRLDGFHSYNKCCRQKEDSGRSKDNLKSYTKDRRAYEYWSDGNIHAANQFMGSSYFKDISADHIGPISLGFIHDPNYIQPMSKSDNSSKRDRLSKDTIDEILKRYKERNVYPMTWFNKYIWEYIVSNYKKEPYKIENEYRKALKQNVSNFMHILWLITFKSKKKGKAFLTKYLLNKNYACFNSDYSFDKNGNIIGTTKRHFTKRSDNEFDRYIRIAFESVESYHSKENRNQPEDLTDSELTLVDEIINEIEKGNESIAYRKLVYLVESVEKRIIKII